MPTVKHYITYSTVFFKGIFYKTIKQQKCFLHNVRIVCDNRMIQNRVTSCSFLNRIGILHLKSLSIHSSSKIKYNKKDKIFLALDFSKYKQSCRSSLYLNLSYWKINFFQHYTKRGNACSLVYRCSIILLYKYQYFTNLNLRLSLKPFGFKESSRWDYVHLLIMTQDDHHHHL